MASDMVVRARIDAQVRRRPKVLAGIGLSVSDAIRLLLVRVAAEEGLPFEIEVLNTDGGARERGRQGLQQRRRADR